jgi:hypothetical protein
MNRCSKPPAAAAAQIARRSAARQPRRTLALLDAYVAALGESLVVPYSPQLNPPLWEAGHVAWFQDYWIARSRSVSAASPATPTTNGPRAHAAGRCAVQLQPRRPRHALGLPLPDLAMTRDYLAASLDETLALLAGRRKATTRCTSTAWCCSTRTCTPKPAIYMAQALDIAAARRRCCAPSAARRKRARWASLRSPGRSAGAGDGFCLRQRTDGPCKVAVGEFRDRQRGRELGALPALRRSHRRRAAALPAPAGRRAGSAANSAVASALDPRRAGHASHLARSGSLVPLGRPAPAHRSGVGAAA